MFEIRNETEIWYKAKEMVDWIHYGSIFVAEPVEKEKFADGLITLGKEQLTELIEEDGKAEIQCQFCNKLYNFNKEELEEILEKV